MAFGDEMLSQWIVMTCVICLPSLALITYSQKTRRLAASILYFFISGYVMSIVSAFCWYRWVLLAGAVIAVCPFIVNLMNTYHQLSAPSSRTDTTPRPHAHSSTGTGLHLAWRVYLDVGVSLQTTHPAATQRTPRCSLTSATRSSLTFASSESPAGMPVRLPAVLFCFSLLVIGRKECST